MEIAMIEDISRLDQFDMGLLCVGFYFIFHYKLLFLWNTSNIPLTMPKTTYVPNKIPKSFNVIELLGNKEFIKDKAVTPTINPKLYLLVSDTT
jgi:hypothetical protein